MTNHARLQCLDVIDADWTSCSTCAVPFIAARPPPPARHASHTTAALSGSLSRTQYTTAPYDMQRAACAAAERHGRTEPSCASPILTRAAVLTLNRHLWHALQFKMVFKLRINGVLLFQHCVHKVTIGRLQKHHVILLRRCLLQVVVRQKVVV